MASYTRSLRGRVRFGELKLTGRCVQFFYGKDRSERIAPYQAATAPWPEGFCRRDIGWQAGGGEGRVAVTPSFRGGCAKASNPDRHPGITVKQPRDSGSGAHSRRPNDD